MQQPIKLPKHICDALDTLKSRGMSSDYIAWNIPGYSDGPGAWGILYEYCKGQSFLNLTNALQHGYEPIKTKRDELIELLECDSDAISEVLAEAILDMFNVDGDDLVE